MVIDPGTPNSTTDVYFFAECSNCTELALDWLVNGQQPLPDPADLFEAIPPQGGLNFKYSVIPAEVLTFGANVTWTATATLAETWTDTESGYFVVANSHPVARLDPWFQYYSGGTTVNRNVTTYYGNAFTFSDKENRTPFTNEYGEDDWQHLSYNWSWADGTPNSTTKFPSHAFFGVGDFPVRVRVDDSLNQTTGDVVARVRNITPVIRDLYAMEMPAFDSATSTDPDDPPVVSNVVRVSFSWTDDDVNRSADNLNVSIWNVDGASETQVTTRLYSSTNATLGLNTVAIEIAADLLDGDEVKICIHDSLATNTYVNGVLKVLGTTLSVPDKICLKRLIMRDILPLDLRGIKVYHIGAEAALPRVVGDVTEVFRQVPLETGTLEGDRKTELNFTMAIDAAIGERARIVSIDSLGYPLTPNVEKKLAEARDWGLLIVAPVEHSGFTATNYFTAAGIGASSWVIGVAPANQSMNGTAAGSPSGPAALMKPKPDFIVAVRNPDAPSPALEAVRDTVDLLSLIMLKGVTDPYVATSYLKTLAVPAWDDTNVTIANAWQQGHGVLKMSQILGFAPDATFSPANVSGKSNLTWNGTARLNHLLDLAPTSQNLAADFGATNRGSAVTTHLTFVNPSKLLPNLLDQVEGSPRDTLTANSQSVPTEGHNRTGRVNTTFYYFPETLVNNASEAFRSLGHATAISTLKNSWSDATVANVTLATDSSIVTSLESTLGSVTNGLKPYYFVDERTVNVSGDWQVEPLFPNIGPLLDLINASYNRTQVLRYDGTLTFPQRMVITLEGLNLTANRTRLLAARNLSEVNQTVAYVNASLKVVRGLAGGDPIVVPLSKLTWSYLNQTNRLMLRTVGSALPIGSRVELNLTTWLNRTSEAPYGYYFGVVRVMADSICEKDTITGEDVYCRRVGAHPCGLDNSRV
ncbi:MAG: hypothetical protein HY556_04840 [Euryarchaeota archaeon]|nr:hypothetical protein [Euryarchaeota archaeon]